MTERTVRKAASNRVAGNSLSKADRLFAQWRKLPSGQNGVSVTLSGEPRFTGIAAQMLDAAEEESGFPARAAIAAVMLYSQRNPKADKASLFEHARKGRYLEVFTFGQLGRFETLKVNPVGICVLIKDGKRTYINLKQSLEWYRTINRAEWWEDSSTNREGMLLWFGLIERYIAGLGVADVSSLNQWEGGAQ
jgi:hypothetical protein